MLLNRVALMLMQGQPTEEDVQRFLAFMGFERVGEVEYDQDNVFHCAIMQVGTLETYLDCFCAIEPRLSLLLC